MHNRTLERVFIILVVTLIGTIVFLFGTPRFMEFLNKRNMILSNLTLKLDVIAAQKNSKSPEIQALSQDGISSFIQQSKDLCQKQFFGLKKDCTYRDLNSSNLLKLNDYLEEVIQEIVELQ